MKFSLATLFAAGTAVALVSAHSLPHEGTKGNDDTTGEICIEVIVPCPRRCLTTCIYPDLPCPKQYTPHCPRHERRKPKSKRDNNDFMSLAFAEDVPEGSICSNHICPQIYKPCSKECPLNCEFINPADPCCPFTGETICPPLK